MHTRGKPAGSRDITPKVRQAFLKALENMKTKGTITDMADVFEEMIAQDTYRAFDVLAKFCPKELMLEVEQRNYVISAEPMSLDEWQECYCVPTLAKN